MESRRLLFVAFLVVAVMEAMPTAVARDPVYLVASEVGAGTCSPAIAVVGQMVDCSFAIPPGSQLDPWGPHHADVDLPYDEDNDDHPACGVDGDRLLCRGVFAYYALGERRVTPIVSGVRATSRATFRVVDSWSQPVSLTAQWGGEQYVFSGHPLGVWIDGPERTSARFASVRTREDGRLMATLELPSVEEGTFEPVDIDPGDLPPGRYLITPCMGDTRVDCVEVPGGLGFQVGSGRLVEVIPGWNQSSADRINIVFAPSGDTQPDEALVTIRSLLGWDGPLPIGEGDAVVSDPRPGLVWWVQFGPFAMEPLRSNRSRFNLWMIDDVLVSPRSLDHTAPPMGWDRPAPDFGLPDVQVSVVDVMYPGRYRRSEALWPSFSTPDGPVPITREGLVFASAYLAVFPLYSRGQATTLTHEWGHALFDLRDEYVEPDRGVTYGYPNCAPDEATAREWWGDLAGSVDPFYDEYAALLDSFGLEPDALLRERLTVGFVTGGCYSPGDDAVRPTTDSMMNSEIPVFGSVNRRRVEEVLSLWSGRIPFSFDSVSITCTLGERRQREAFCSLEVAPHVEVPADRVTLSVGTRQVVCDAGTPDGDGWRIPCGVVPLTGPGPWEATVTVGERSATLLVSGPSWRPSGRVAVEAATTG